MSGRTSVPAPRRPVKAVSPGAASVEVETLRGFHVHLDVFEGPFDLLLSLVAKHKLDLTEVALAR